MAFFLVWEGLALSIYGKELVELFAQQESYHPAEAVVPLIVLAYIIYGISLICPSECISPAIINMPHILRSFLQV